MRSARILGVIPARSGSKEIKNKNTRLLAGRPLLQYTTEVALAANVFTRVVLSTDSPEIAELGRSLGVEVPFLRPEPIARDDTPMLPVVEHVIDFMETTEAWQPELIVLLQPTSPFRTADHIQLAVQILLGDRQYDAVVSVVELPKRLAPPSLMKIENGLLEHYLPSGKAVHRRQDMQSAYVRCGSIYAITRDALRRTRSFYGERCCPLVLSSKEVVNIDSEEDWQQAEAILSRRHR